MYYINRARIDDRISFIAYIKQAITRLQAQWIEGEPLLVLAEERVIHLAIEVVTDIGSDLIDGLMLREASSYVDIVKVLQGEDVFPQHTAKGTFIFKNFLFIKKSILIYFYCTCSLSL